MRKAKESTILARRLEGLDGDPSPIQCLACGSILVYVSLVWPAEPINCCQCSACARPHYIAKAGDGTIYVASAC